MQVRAVSDVIACGIQPIQVQCILYSWKLSREKTHMNNSKQEFTVEDLSIAVLHVALLCRCPTQNFEVKIRG